MRPPLSQPTLTRCRQRRRPVASSHHRHDRARRRTRCHSRGGTQQDKGAVSHRDRVAGFAERLVAAWATQAVSSGIATAFLAGGSVTCGERRPGRTLPLTSRPRRCGASTPIPTDVQLRRARLIVGSLCRPASDPAKASMHLHGLRGPVRLRIWKPSIGGVFACRPTPAKVTLTPTSRCRSETRERSPGRTNAGRRADLHRSPIGYRAARKLQRESGVGRGGRRASPHGPAEGFQGRRARGAADAAGPRSGRPSKRLAFLSTAAPLACSTCAWSGEGHDVGLYQSYRLGRVRLAHSAPHPPRSWSRVRWRPSRRRRRPTGRSCR